MHEFGTTAAHLAEVAVAARTWASPNPKAWSRGPLTVDDVLASRPVSTPLKVRDCCLVTDGGAAIVLVRSDRTRGVLREPIFVLGAGEATSHRHISSMPDLTTTAAVQSGARAYAMAQMTASDIDVLQLYDAFTTTPILFLEDLGFCPKGEGGPFVEGGKLRLGGDLPLNTNGGGHSPTSIPECTD
jgi:acetyl-CoA acetyltransferase